MSQIQIVGRLPGGRWGLPNVDITGIGLEGAKGPKGDAAGLLDRQRQSEPAYYALAYIQKL